MKKVAIVADNDLISLEIFSKILILLNFKVNSFDDLSVALDFIENNNLVVDLLLVGFQSSEAEGEQLLGNCKKINPEIKVIGTSGYISEKDISKEKCDAFFMKPVLASCFIEKLKEIK